MATLAPAATNAKQWKFPASQPFFLFKVTAEA